MNIYYPLSSSQSTQSIDLYQVKSRIQKAQLLDRIDNLLLQYHDDPDSVFLLNEDFFDLVRYSIEGKVYEPLRIDQLDSLVHKKIQEAKSEHHIVGKKLLYDIDNIRVNGQAVDYLLGQEGMLQRDLFLVFLKPAIALSLPHLDTKGPIARIYPASYFTVQYITKQLNIASFGILTFYDTEIKLILIKDGFYADSMSLDWGIDSLKQILISHNMIDYFNKSTLEIAANPLAHDILQEKITFYITIVLDWLAEHAQGITNYIINYPELRHTLVQQLFEQTYQHKIGGYLIPNSLHHQLNNYARSWKPKELDVLSFLNFNDSKELI